jgi:hypothetical protein
MTISHQTSATRVGTADLAAVPFPGIVLDPSSLAVLLVVLGLVVAIIGRGAGAT